MYMSHIHMGLWDLFKFFGNNFINFYAWTHLKSGLQENFTLNMKFSLFWFCFAFQKQVPAADTWYNI